MTDNDPFEHQQNDEKITAAEVEQSHNRRAFTKVESIIGKNPLTTQKKYIQGSSIYEEISSQVTPHEHDQTLHRLGYSSVGIAELIDRRATGEVVYPITINVTTYDLEGDEKDSFDISKVSDTEVIIEKEDTDQLLPFGFDVETGGLTDDPERMDPEKADGFLPGSRPLKPHERLELQSILDVCELTVANIKE